MNYLSPLLFEAKSSSYNLVGRVATTAPAGIKSNKFNHFIVFELAGPLLHCRETVITSTLIAVFLAADNTNFHY
jgi:hypothetical protein